MLPCSETGSGMQDYLKIYTIAYVAVKYSFLYSRMEKTQNGLWHHLFVKSQEAASPVKKMNAAGRIFVSFSTGP